MVQDSLFHGSNFRRICLPFVMLLLASGLVKGADVYVDADGTGGNGRNNGAADNYRVVLNGTDLEVYIDGNLSQSVPFDSIVLITVEGSSDDDTLTVDLSGGNPIPIGGITFNGRAQTSKDTLCLSGGSATSITYNFVNTQDGTVDVDGRIITYTGLEPVVDTVASGFIIFNGTNAVNSINYTVGTTTANGLLSVDGSETVEFSNKTNVLINCSSGADTINLNNNNTPTGLTGIIGIIGAGPTGGDGDTLIVNGVAGQLDNLRYQPTSLGAGTIINDNQPQPNVLFTGIERVILVVQQNDDDGVRVDGTTGNDEIEFFHGQTADSGSFVGTMDQNNATGSGPFPMTPMSFIGEGALGNDADVNFFNPGGTDTFVFNATGNNDIITVQGGEAGGTEFRDTLNGVVVSRLELFNISGGVVRTLDGNDTVNVNAPAGPAAVTLSIEGGSGSNVLNFGTFVASTTVNLGAATISGVGINTITYSGFDVLNVNSNNKIFNLSGTTGDDLLEITPTGANAVTARLAASTPAVGATPIVNGSNITTFNVDLLTGSNQLTVNGTQGANTVTVTGALVTVNALKTVNYTNVQNLAVNCLAGDDTVTVTPSATVAIFIDGGDSTISPGNKLTVVSNPGDTVVLNSGGTSDSGSFVVNANQPVSFLHFDFGVAPQLTSTPAATPNPAPVGQAVTFAVGTSGGIGTVTVTWDFGDGSTGTGSTTTHAYAAAGTYTVTVSVSDGVHPAASSTLAVTASTGKLSVAKASIKLNFAKPGNDAIAISGVLLIPDGFSVSGKTVNVDVGGIAKTFTLNEKGASPKGNDMFAVAVKSNKGVTPLQVSKYAIKLSKGNFAASLADDGLVNATVSTKVTVPITVTFNGEFLQKSLSQSYKATAGKSGATK